jgi:hypothetical protein
VKYGERDRTYSGSSSGGQSSSLTRKKTAADLFGSVTVTGRLRCVCVERGCGGTGKGVDSLMLGMFGFSSANECMCSGRLFNVDTLKCDPTSSPNLSHQRPIKSK